MAAKPMQKARAGMSVSDEDLAKYTAARAFLFGEWVGALLMVASFTQLYWFILARPGGNTPLLMAVAIGMLVLGAWMFWKNRSYYLSLEWPYKRAWEIAATVVAGAGAVFWLMFLVMTLMAMAGKPLLPE